MKYKGIYFIVALVAGSILFSGCSRDERSTGIEYAPQMYRSIPLEPYTQVAGEYSPFADSLNAQVPPSGTVHQDDLGSLDFIGDQTDDERKRAAETLKNPMNYAPEIVGDAGKVLFERYCAICHGKKGAGDGNIPKAGIYPAPPAFGTRTTDDLKEGEIFYNITYGKNAMGSYASQLSQQERWLVTQYVQTLQKKVETTEGGEEGADGAEEGDAVEGEVENEAADMGVEVEEGAVEGNE